VGFEEVFRGPLFTLILVWLRGGVGLLVRERGVCRRKEIVRERKRQWQKATSEQRKKRRRFDTSSTGKLTKGAASMLALRGRVPAYKRSGADRL
jgi:hypothetical protein